MKAYKHSQDELEILRLLSRGDKQIEAGKGYELDKVLAEADSLMKDSLDRGSTSRRTP